MYTYLQSGPNPLACYITPQHVILCLLGPSAQPPCCFYVGPFLMQLCWSINTIQWTCANSHLIWQVTHTIIPASQILIRASFPIKVLVNRPDRPGYRSLFATLHMHVESADLAPIVHANVALAKLFSSVLFQRMDKGPSQPKTRLQKHHKSRWKIKGHLWNRKWPDSRGSVLH